MELRDMKGLKKKGRKLNENQEEDIAQNKKEQSNHNEPRHGKDRKSVVSRLGQT